MKTLLKIRIGNFDIAIILILLIFCLSVSSVYAQDYTLGSISSLKNELRKDLKNKQQAKNNKDGRDLTVQLSKKDKLPVKVNFININENEATLSGEVIGENGSYFISIKGNEILGNIILKDKNYGFEYYADENGDAHIKKTDLNDLLCVNYNKQNGPQTKTNRVNKGEVAEIPANLQSLPGARGCVLLDFDGHYVSGTGWNNGNPINAAHSGMSDNAIREAWEIVSEDFRPFSVNITTSESVFNTYPRNRRMRCIITPTKTAAPKAGGVAYVGSFNWNNDTPCWTFLLNGKSCGEATSHEIGHTFDLRHDGRHNPEEGYYSGHGEWAPIMGVGYYKPVSQWSRGEYNSANNQQNDLETIAQNKFGVGYRGDDHGGNINNSTPLNVKNTGVIEPANYGIIERTGDYDFFSFTTSGGNISLDINTVNRHADLNIIVRLYNTNGQEIAYFNPPGLNASVNTTLAAGNYYISVDGIGDGEPVWNGYSDYGSLGQYWITGNLNPGSDYGVVTLHGDCNGGGTSTKFMEGNFTANQLGVGNDKASSITIAPGYVVELFKDNNFQGQSITLTGTDNCLVDNDFNDVVSSMRVYAKGIEGLAGEYFIRNSFSALNLDLAAADLNNGANMHQWTINNTDAQKFILEGRGNGVYNIKSKISGKYLDAAEVSTNNGVNFQQWEYNPDGLNQQFIIIKTDDGFYQLVARHSGKVVDCAGPSTEKGANIHQWYNNRQAGSKWFLVPIRTGIVSLYQHCDYGGYYISLNEGVYSYADLKERGMANDDISSLTTTPGFVVDIYKDDDLTGDKKTISSNSTCIGDFNDLVTSIEVRAKGISGLDGEYYFRNAFSAKNLDVAGASTQNGGNVQQWNINQQVAQQFNVIEAGNGVYHIQSKASNKYLDIDAGKTTNGANAFQWSFDPNARNQQFIIIKTTDNFYQLVARHSGKVIECDGPSLNAGANIHQWTNNRQNGSKWYMVPFTEGIVTVYESCDYKGYSVKLNPGTYTYQDLRALGIANDDISSIKTPPGFEVDIYRDDNRTGAKKTIIDNTPCLGNIDFDNAISSIEIRAKGTSGLNGEYSLRNVFSKLNMDLEGGSLNNGANISQYAPSFTINQKFVFEEIENGVYKILSKTSNKSLDVNGANLANGANVIQHTFGNNTHQKFIVLKTTEGYYQLIALHSGKVLEVADFSKANGGNVQQWDNNNQSMSKWWLVKEGYNIATVYSECEYKGYPIKLEEGEYTMQDLFNLGIDNDDISSLSIFPGYTVTLYVNDNFTGTSQTLTTSTPCLDFNNKATSLIIKAKGVSNLSGTYFLENNNSGLVASLETENGNANGNNYVVEPLTNRDDQQLKFEEQENGVYVITNGVTEKSLDINGISRIDGANLQQWIYESGYKNKEFIIVDSGNDTYQLVARHSGKVLVTNENNIHQFTNTNQANSKWRLTDVLITSINQGESTAIISIYPNPTQHELHIQTNERIEQVEVSDITGKVLFNTKENNIPVSGLEAGTYLIQIKTQTHTETQSFIKQ